VLISWYAFNWFRSFYHEQAAGDLKARTQLAGQEILSSLNEKNFGDVDLLCKKLGAAGQTRFTVILPDGKVVGDSDQQPAVMENHADRPEFIEAMKGKTGRSVRFSETLGKDMMYIAVALKVEDEVKAIVRGSLSVAALGETMSDIYRKIATAGAVIAVLAAIVTLVISRKITRPIEEMKEAAEQYAAGRFDRRAPAPSSAELAGLAGCLNEMAGRLKQTIETITTQRNQLEAVLASMAEGVIAVDSEGNVVSINKAAARLLGIDADSAAGRSINEVVRNIDIQRFLRQTFASTDPVEADVVLATEPAISLHLRGTHLAGKKENNKGVVVVLRDMTRMRRLENIKRDFVANVSHELRTPITSIKGFVETLSDGAINEPEQAQKFLKIIAGHTDRLMAIIEDLLSLSRLEEDGRVREITMEQLAVKPILESAIELCGHKVDDKNIKIELDCPNDIEIPMNPTLLEQAVFNLIDNAIKYSPTHSTVQVITRKSDAEVIIAVKDFGCGIEKPHLERIFERFYVVDKARSRKLGGTGLGLSIVKHITQIHAGSITVESIPGQGSTFTLRLPVK
jgi:two-component system phosphate regulon sensor histidine kinase PhoR